jgi:TetR/AcrR family transcriptional repressor of nem operon
MGRVSREQARENREQVVSTAARLFRERGVQGVSVADLMAEIGLTHGGFYRQFDSKDALVAEATERAFEGMTALLDGFTEKHGGDQAAARQELVDYYLSARHRDDSGHGCPSAGLAGDLAREGGAARAPFAEGVRRSAEWLGDGELREGLATLSTLVGALILARATAGTGISDELLDAAHAAVSAH